MIDAYIYIFPEKDKETIKIGKLSFPSVPQEGNLIVFDKISRPVIFKTYNTNQFKVIETSYRIDKPISVHLFLKPLYF